MISLCISAPSSNSGKTLLTTALLYHYKKSVRAFKIGPDYIDPQFHAKVCGNPSVNLDTFIMNPEQVKWLYKNYSDKSVSILEGVMGFYDGMDKGCSAYDVSRLLDVPVVLVLDGSGSYITVSAILKGLKEYRNDTCVKGVVLNRISSQMHYELIRDIIKTDHPDIEVLGWVENNLETLNDTHLGLDLEDISKIEKLADKVLENIDIKLLEKVCDRNKPLESENYPFDSLIKQNKHLCIVNDENFSFLYHDNLQFFKEVFEKVTLISSTKDETVPEDADIVYIPGGYVESDNTYNRVKDSVNFKNSLIKHSSNKKIYAECAGLLYLGNSVDDKTMSGILDIDFTLGKRFARLGYYYNEAGVKGHSFHYTKPTEQTLEKGCEILSKKPNGKGAIGSWKNKEGNIFGTYLHTMFRNNVKLVKDKFL